MSPADAELIGKRVHYQPTSGPEASPYAAVITAVKPQARMSLIVMSPRGITFLPNVDYAWPVKPGHWSWPPIVDDEGEPLPQPPPPTE